LKITESEVRYVADLANLRLSDAEIARMAREMDAILTHMDKLNELNTTGVPPMAQVLYEAGETATLRDDEPHVSFTNEEALGSAPNAAGGFFKVPKVIER
jgi:aspartyl-tRNA(Asn)/glutamyl-tRNA(Gln) amidotransferase subunit C